MPGFILFLKMGTCVCPCLSIPWSPLEVEGQLAEADSVQLTVLTGEVA